jgi:hypothetical protein
MIRRRMTRGILDIEDAERYAVKCGDCGFTSSELAAAYNSTTKHARDLIYEMLGCGFCVETKLMRRHKTASTSMRVFIVSTSAVDSIRKDPDKIVNVMDALAQVGHDEDFQDRPASMPTNEPPGSREKIEVMRGRVERGESLWNEMDATDYSMLASGAKRGLSWV